MKLHYTRTCIMHNGACNSSSWYKRSDHAWQDGIRKDYKGVYECSKCHRLVITDHMGTEKVESLEEQTSRIEDELRTQ